ncbi:hypothetical protein PSTG_01477 [Puccinia striiformis f. sp. tritici PST-78]|uniref:RING-type domain-containing protein n=1 Tax=Puccinia striiformis f. sp. tritici PST-78 TaxID=1165861 RepID=A0A0L0W139_9BASI|nr:hypothetical protein PSTG_01477 [Puccinia striiformis f. sp. tritici PST-78]
MRWILALVLATSLVLHLVVAPEVVKIMCNHCNRQTNVMERCQTSLPCGHACPFINSTQCPQCQGIIQTGHDHARPIKCSTCKAHGGATAPPSGPHSASSSRSSSMSASGALVNGVAGSVVSIIRHPLRAIGPQHFASARVLTLMSTKVSS